MTTDAVLVLGTSATKYLTDLLFDAGFAPLVRHTMQSALERLHRGKFAAVIVDRDHVEADVLEFVLNVRDIDHDTPVVVINGRDVENENGALQSQHQTFLVEKMDGPEQLAKDIEALVTGEKAG